MSRGGPAGRVPLAALVFLVTGLAVVFAGMLTEQNMSWNVAFLTIALPGGACLFSGPNGAAVTF